MFPKIWQTWEGVAAPGGEELCSLLANWRNFKRLQQEQRNYTGTSQREEGGAWRQRGEEMVSSPEQHISSAGRLLQLESAGLQASCLRSHAEVQQRCAKDHVQYTAACAYQAHFWSSFNGRLHNCLLAWGHFCTGHVIGWSFWHEGSFQTVRKGGPR